MSGAADPVGIGFVQSLARPGGNITGLSLQSPELAGKRLELLRDIAPKLSRISFLAYGPDPAHRLFVKEAQDSASAMNLEVLPLVVETTDQIDET
jgi:putative ABC transport system substrate-binding protein